MEDYGVQKQQFRGFIGFSEIFFEGFDIFGKFFRAMNYLCSVSNFS